MSRLGYTTSKRRSRSARAGLLFPVGRIHRICRKEKWAAFSRVGKLAPVYLTAVLEYVVAEMVEQTGLLAKLLGHDKRISPKHIRLAVTNDDGNVTKRICIVLTWIVFLYLEFAKLFPGAIFAGSGGGKISLDSAKAELRGEIVEEERKKPKVQSSSKRSRSKINKRHKIILIDEDEDVKDKDDDAITISDISDDENLGDFENHGVSFLSEEGSNSDLGRYDTNMRKVAEIH